MMLFDQDYIDEIAKREAYKEGIVEGEARGEARGRASTLRDVAAMLKMGHSIEEILATCSL